MSREITPAFLDELEAILRQHHGKENAITSGELASSCGVADGEANPKTREAVKVLIRERQVPVGSCSQGYYIMTCREELEENLSGIRSRIAGMEERMQIMVEAFEQGRTDDDPDDPAFECECGFATDDADDMALLDGGALGCPECNQHASAEGATA